MFYSAHNKKQRHSDHSDLTTLPNNPRGFEEGYGEFQGFILEPVAKLKTSQPREGLKKINRVRKESACDYHRSQKKGCDGKDCLHRDFGTEGDTTLLKRLKEENAAKSKARPLLRNKSEIRTCRNAEKKRKLEGTSRQDYFPVIAIDDLGASTQNSSFTELNDGRPRYPPTRSEVIVQQLGRIVHPDLDNSYETVSPQPLLPNRHMGQELVQPFRTSVQPYLPSTFGAPTKSQARAKEQIVIAERPRVRDREFDRQSMIPNRSLAATTQVWGVQSANLSILKSNTDTSYRILNPVDTQPNAVSQAVASEDDTPRSEYVTQGSYLTNQFSPMIGLASHDWHESPLMPGYAASQDSTYIEPGADITGQHGGVNPCYEARHLVSQMANCGTSSPPACHVFKINDSDLTQTATVDNPFLMGHTGDNHGSELVFDHRPTPLSDDEKTLYESRLSQGDVEHSKVFEEYAGMHSYSAAKTKDNREMFKDSAIVNLCFTESPHFSSNEWLL